MNHSSKHGSLRAKIWTAAMAAAAADLVVCLAVLYFVENGSSALLFLIPISISVGLFFLTARYMAGAAVSPVEKLSLLAKSFERGSLGAVPPSTGSYETDELLRIIVRIGGQQPHDVGRSLDDAAESGPEMDAVNPDIADKHDLADAPQERLGSLLAAIKLGTNAIKRFRSDGTNTPLVLDDIEFSEFADELNGLIGDIAKSREHAIDSDDPAPISAGGVRDSIRKAIAACEQRLEKLTRTAFESGTMTRSITEIASEIEAALKSSSADSGTWNADSSDVHNIDTANDIRRRAREILKTVQAVQVNSRKICDVSESANDLTRRAKLVAVNASLQMMDASRAEKPNAVFAAEIESLAHRCELFGKEVSQLDLGVNGELGSIEAALNQIVSETAEFVDRVSGDSEDIDHADADVANTAVATRIDELSRELTAEAEKAFNRVAAFITETENELALLRSVEAAIESPDVNLPEFVEPAVDPVIEPAEIAQAAVPDVEANDDILHLDAFEVPARSESGGDLLEI